MDIFENSKSEIFLGVGIQRQKDIILFLWKLSNWKVKFVTRVLIVPSLPEYFWFIAVVWA